MQKIIEIDDLLSNHEEIASSVVSRLIKETVTKMVIGSKYDFRWMGSTNETFSRWFYEIDGVYAFVHELLTKTLTNKVVAKLKAEAQHQAINWINKRRAETYYVKERQGERDREAVRLVLEQIRIMAKNDAKQIFESVFSNS